MSHSCNIFAVDSALRLLLTEHIFINDKFGKTHETFSCAGTMKMKIDDLNMYERIAEISSHFQSNLLEFEGKELISNFLF